MPRAELVPIQGGQYDPVKAATNRILEREAEGPLPMRYAFEKKLAQVADSRLWIAAVVVLFGLSAGCLELLIHSLLLRTGASVLTQSLLDAAIVAIAAGFAPLFVLLGARERHQRVLDDLRKLAQLNHHVRNALQTIVYNEYSPKSEQHKDAVLAGVMRIDSILQELFPVVGDRSSDKGWKVIRIDRTRVYVPDRRHSQ
jgi:hypothetical protein